MDIRVYIFKYILFTYIVYIIYVLNIYTHIYVKIAQDL